MSDREIGLNAVSSYHAYMRVNYPATFRYTKDEFLNILTKIKGGKSLLEGLGLGIREAGLSSSRVNRAMSDLARAGGGRIPASFMDFFNFLTKESAKISYVDAAVFVVSESAKDVAGAAQAVGDQLIFTGKILTFILPIILLGLVFWWLNKQTGGDLGRGLKALRK